MAQVDGMLFLVACVCNFVTTFETLFYYSRTQDNCYNCRYEIYRTDRLWYLDYAIKFATCQHPAVRRGSLSMVWFDVPLDTF